MKKVIALLLVLSLCVGLFATTVFAANPFTDISPKDWFYNDIISAYDMGLINGKTATEYKPNLVLRVFADYHYMTMSLDNLALFADFLYGRLYFHCDFHLSVFLSEAGRSILLLFVRPPWPHRDCTAGRFSRVPFRWLKCRPSSGTESRTGTGSLGTKGRSFVLSCRRIYDLFPAI